MIRNLRNEEWKEIKFDEKISVKEVFLISNYGRIIDDSKEDKVLKKQSFINGYETISLKQEVNKKSTSRYIHKLVAQHFLEKENEEQIYVLHVNYDKKDNSLENLIWATKREKELHQFKNPVFIESRKNIKYNSKLTEGKVKIIKKQLRNNRTRITMIAKRFGVSDMQIHRIKSGENWSKVEI
ncbi:NUMOD4 domain-containing protein [Polaribacter sp. PL03]|uniref:NUMOD4 domain-containing protein n=1 Tax=Polaribacter sp. PL03 TaxID=3088353 RepID=UPI0029D265AC|nr:NUMOD4 domain-containing protein [Polaribacter sp. PL03]MDX6747253.1 NUMOD4 domain-containing protein [Polaribacter sp. PL03]